MTQAHDWQAGARAAALPGPVVPPDALLLLRDRDGRNLRPSDPPPGVTPRTGAVLLLLYPDGDDVRLPLTVRSDKLPNHRGEVSLPGGATDPGDGGPAATALRECFEELGVDPHTVELLGTLTPIYIPPSNFAVTPIVGWSAAPPLLHVNLDEVSAVLTVTLRELCDPASVTVEQWTRRGEELTVPYFTVGGHKVWGATALMLSEFVARLRRQMSDE